MPVEGERRPQKLRTAHDGHVDAEEASDLHRLVTLTAHRVVHRTKLSKHLHVLGLRGADGATYEAVLKRERLADGLPACCLGDALTVTGTLSRKNPRHPGPSRTVAATSAKIDERFSELYGFKAAFDDAWPSLPLRSALLPGPAPLVDGGLEAAARANALGTCAAPHVARVAQ